MIHGLSFTYDCNIKSNGKVIRHCRCHPDDVGALFDTLATFRSAVVAKLADICLIVVPRYDVQYDVFKIFDMIDTFYNSLISLTSHYNDLPADFKETFSYDFLQELRQKVFVNSLLNKI